MTNPLIAIYLQRLARSNMWAEERRVNGYIRLVGVGTGGRVLHEDCVEGVLVEMLGAGLVKCSAQQRIAEDPTHSRLRPADNLHEVTVKYWSVLEQEAKR